jgi:hypothetical protein
MLNGIIRAAALTLALAACATAQTPPSATTSPRAMDRSPAGTLGPVRNMAAQPGQEIVTIRYFRIKKGSFPQFLEASRTGVWPFFEKIGARIVGMWQVIPPQEGPNAGRQVSPDYDEAYLMTRYASLEHWSATRNAAAMGGDGPDYATLQKALAIRQSLTLETKVTYLQGVTGPLPPVFMPGTGEKFVPAP